MTNNFHLITLCVAIFFRVKGDSIPGKALFGSFQFEDEFDTNLGPLHDQEAWLGVKFTTTKFFTNMCAALASSQDFFNTVVIPNHLNAIWNNRLIPMLTWQPSCYQPDLPTLSSYDSDLKIPDNFISALASVGVPLGQGTYDSYISRTASVIKTFLSGPDGIYGTADDRRMYMRLAHEMNGNNYPWGAVYNPFMVTTDYINMWRRIYNIFEETLTITIIDSKPYIVDRKSRLQWIWCVNNFDAGSGNKTAIPAEQYYPGDSYVDWIGLDIYNFFGDSPLAAPQMNPMLDRLLTIAPNKPIAIPEYGALYNQFNPDPVGFEGGWYDDFFIQAKHYNVKLLIQFNDPKYEFSVYNGPQIPNITTYISPVQNASSSWFLPYSATNSRLISEEAFQGQPASSVAIDVPKKKATHTLLGLSLITMIIIVAAVICLCCLCLIVVYYYFRVHKRRHRHQEDIEAGAWPFSGGKQDQDFLSVSQSSKSSARSMMTLQSEPDASPRVRSPTQRSLQNDTPGSDGKVQKKRDDRKHASSAAAVAADDETKSAYDTDTSSRKSLRQTPNSINTSNTKNKPRKGDKKKDRERDSPRGDRDRDSPRGDRGRTNKKDTRDRDRDRDKSPGDNSRRSSRRKDGDRDRDRSGGGGGRRDRDRDRDRDKDRDRDDDRRYSRNYTNGGGGGVGVVSSYRDDSDHDHEENCPAHPKNRDSYSQRSVSPRQQLQPQEDNRYRVPSDVSHSKSPYNGETW